jgi:hypothetical protein
MGINFQFLNKLITKYGQQHMPMSMPNQFKSQDGLFAMNMRESRSRGDGFERSPVPSGQFTSSQAGGLTGQDRQIISAAVQMAAQAGANPRAARIIAEQRVKAFKDSSATLGSKAQEKYGIDDKNEAKVVDVAEFVKTYLQVNGRAPGSKDEYLNGVSKVASQDPANEGKPPFIPPDSDFWKVDPSHLGSLKGAMDTGLAFKAVAQQKVK